MHIEWKSTKAPVGYDDAVAFMEARVAAIHAQKVPGCLWLLEHPALYTAGTSANAADLLDARFPVHQTGRGGQYTYHGPGQRVGYVMMDLHLRGAPDLRRYIHDLESVLIGALADFGVTGARRDGRVGIWVVLPDGTEAKIAAIGVRVRRWVAYHGFSLNVDPDLSHFSGIVPCGIAEHGVTSLKSLGVDAEIPAVDAAIKSHFMRIFCNH
jgi:lipoyl(octanoyl) transferase